MWTPKHRCAADGSGLRYPSDLSAPEWAFVEPTISPPRHGGVGAYTILHRLRTRGLFDGSSEFNSN